MKQNTILLLAALFLATQLQAQLEPSAGSWPTWFISSGKIFRLPAPPSIKGEIAEVLSRQQALDSAGWQQIRYWNAGAPGYRWQAGIKPCCSIVAASFDQDRHPTWPKTWPN